LNRSSTSSPIGSNRLIFAMSISFPEAVVTR
jgi:hypothetical protein